MTNCSGAPTVCEPLWRVAGAGALPIVANGIEFVGGATPNGGGALPFEAFDANGTNNCSGVPVVCMPLWTADVDAPVAGSPAIVNGVVYVATFGTNTTWGTLHAYGLP